MKRRAVVVLGLALLAIAGVVGMLQAGAASAADRYAVPAGGVAELVKFIETLTQYRPGTLQEDFQHRARLRPALQQAAERILKLEKDRSSEACQAAEFIVLANRARWLAQVEPEQQRQVVADVKAYLKRKLRSGNARQAAELAVATGRMLVAAGRGDLAIAASKEVLETLRKSGDSELIELADTLEENLPPIAEAAKAVRPGSLKVPLPPKGRLVPLDLQAKANRPTDAISIAENFAGNGLVELGKGDKVLGKVQFHIGPKLIQLAGGEVTGVPKKIEGIPVQRTVQRVYVLHASQYSADDNTEIGQYVLRYEDGSTASLPIVFGRDLRDWWASDMGMPVTGSKVVWSGSNRCSDQAEILLRLYLAAWENPHPKKKVTQLDYCSTGGKAAPFCVAITVEE